jgi:hypothetical protein
MRLGVYTAAVLCAAWAAGPAHAQTGTSFTTALGGPPPSAIMQKPIDMTNVIAPSPALGAQQSRFNFGALFNKLAVPSFPVVGGTSALPAPSTFPSTSYTPFKMVGKPPYQLGDPRAAKYPFQPVLPIIPNNKPPVGPGS